LVGIGDMSKPHYQTFDRNREQLCGADSRRSIGIDFLYVASGHCIATCLI